MEEKKVWSGTSSQIINLGVYILCGLAFAVLLAAMIRFWPELQRLGSAAQVPAFLVVLSPLGYALFKVILIKSLRYEITSERIMVNSGVFSKKTSTMELYRVKDYSLEAPFFYRLFHLGNIHITTSDKTTPQLTLKAIHNAKKLLDDIRIHVEQRRDLKRVREVDFDQVGDIDGN